MTSTISSAKSKKPLLSMMLWSIRKSLPIAIIYSFLLFVIFPMYIILSRNNSSRSQFDYLDCYEICGMLGSVLICIFTIIIACSMFSIYHNKRSVDLYSSFPIKRHTLFLARYFSGLLLIIVPLIIFMTLGLLASFQITSVNVFITYYRMLAYIISIINMYSMLALFAMLCGGIIDTLISFGVVNIGVASCIYLVVDLISNILPGYYNMSIYVIDRFTRMVFFALCPFSMPFESSVFSGVEYGYVTYGYRDTLSEFIEPESLQIEIKTMVMWLALAIVYFVAAVIIAKKRKNENVQNSFIFSFPKVVIQVIASVAAGIILGYFFAENFLFENDGFKTMLLFMLGALMGSFVSFLIVTIIYNRGAKRFVKSLPAFVGSFAIIAIFYLVISTGLVGVSNVPKVDDIKAVAVFDDCDYYTSDEIEVVFSKGTSFEKVNYFIEDKDIINSVVSLHQSIVDGLHDEMGTFFNLDTYIFYSENEGYEPDTIRIEYELTNGKKVSKVYTSHHYNYSNIIEAYNDIVSSDLYKQNSKLVSCVTADEANVSCIDIYSTPRYTKNSIEGNYIDDSEYIYDEDYYEYIEEDYTEDYNSENLYDAEFVNQIYSSLRKEYLADKNYAETLKARYPEYVKPTDNNAEIYDEIVYNINLRYSTHLGIATEKKIEELGVEYDYCNLDPEENFAITKDSYPKTWELINNYFEQKEIDNLYLYPKTEQINS